MTRTLVSPKIVELVLRIARESPTWSYERIEGALCNLGLEISTTTVANILKSHGIDPAPDLRRQSAWRTFLEAHRDVLASVDFTTIEVWTKSGLGNRLIEAGEEVGRTAGDVACRERLDGMLRYYYPQAA